MKEIAEKVVPTSDVPALLQKLRTDKKYMFKNREELIAYSQAALARAKGARARSFGLWPKADVVIEPYPAFREKNGPNEYNSPAEDGSRPGIFYINAYQPEKHSRVEDESTAFHETIPGHHLQGAIALERKDIHPIGRYFGEQRIRRRLGALFRAARRRTETFLRRTSSGSACFRDQQLRAVRLVVDSGIHTMGLDAQASHRLHAGAHRGRASATPPRKSTATLSIRAKPRRTCSGMIEIRKARDAAQKSDGPNASTSKHFTTACWKTAACR